MLLQILLDYKGGGGGNPNGMGEKFSIILSIEKRTLKWPTN